jgi:hypothetical protein
MGTYAEFVDNDYDGIERSCLARARYDSRREARALVEHGRRSNGQLQPYHCKTCYSWHLGHRRSPKSRRALATKWRRTTRVTWTTKS